MVHKIKTWVLISFWYEGLLRTSNNYMKMFLLLTWMFTSTKLIRVERMVSLLNVIKTGSQTLDCWRQSLNGEVTASRLGPVHWRRCLWSSVLQCQQFRMSQNFLHLNTAHVNLTRMVGTLMFKHFCHKEKIVVKHPWKAHLKIKWIISWTFGQWNNLKICNAH